MKVCTISYYVLAGLLLAERLQEKNVTHMMKAWIKIVEQLQESRLAV